MLGRPPRGTWQVARRCACGLPQVIETASRLDDGTPFPTLWWLTCRSLAHAVGRLEAGGWMASFNERLASEPDLAEALRASTAAYVGRRTPAGRRGPCGIPAAVATPGAASSACTPTPPTSSSPVTTRRGPGCSRSWPGSIPRCRACERGPARGHRRRHQHHP